MVALQLELGESAPAILSPVISVTASDILLDFLSGADPQACMNIEVL